MQFEQQVEIATPAETVFSLYADVGTWAAWDPEVKESSIEGRFASGATGALRPLKGPKTQIFFTEVTENRSFTVESRLPLCVMRFDHELSESPGSAVTKATHRVSFIGLLSPFFGRLIGGQIRRGLPGTMLGLKRAAEERYP
jgi:hypothetical protein